MAIDAYGYVNADTRTFSEIFPSYVEFADFYNNCGIPCRLMSKIVDGVDIYANYGINAIYALLISNYANDHIASYDENRFMLMVMSIIYEAGPAWQRAMEIQDRFLKMDDKIILSGSKAVYNHAMHPDTEPKVNSTAGTLFDEPLPFISDQNTASWTKDNVKGLIEVLYALDDTLCTRFVARFKRLFKKVSYNRPPLLFGTNN